MLLQIHLSKFYWALTICEILCYIPKDALGEGPAFQGAHILEACN